MDKKRLIDANALVKQLEKSHEYHARNCREEVLLYRDIRIINEQPTVDAVEVVFCDECENHGNCYPETIFRLARIEKPFCCVGKRKTNTNCGAKMDGDTE